MASNQPSAIPMFLLIAAVLVCCAVPSCSLSLVGCAPQFRPRVIDPDRKPIFPIRKKKNNAAPPATPTAGTLSAAGWRGAIHLPPIAALNLLSGRCDVAGALIHAACGLSVSSVRGESQAALCSYQARFPVSLLEEVCGAGRLPPSRSNPSPGATATVFCTSPIESVAREHCDRFEVNSFYDDFGRLVFDQILFFDWCDKTERFQLRAWRMVKWYDGTKKSGPAPQNMPRLNQATGLYECRWNDGDLDRCITAPVLMVTRTQYDPELTEREFLPKEKRRELLQPKKRKPTHAHL